MFALKGRTVAAALALALACDDPPAGSCEVVTDCPEGQACAFLGPDEAHGACLEPIAGLGIPGRLGASPVAFAADLDPYCYPRCVRDVDRDTPGLDVACEFVAGDLVADAWITVPACVRDGDAWLAPGGSPRCFILRVEDDLAPECVAAGLNLELELVTTGPDPPHLQHWLDCEPSPDPIHDCPDL